VALVGVAGAPPIHEVAAALHEQLHAGERQEADEATGQRSRASQQQVSPTSTAAQAPHGGSGPGAAGSHGSSASLAAFGLRQGLLVIGPEGDFTPEELEQLLAAGATPVGLGDLRLRAETAAIALLAYVRLQLV
jgi:16S rRNA U1498 N3-methylase RsmE